MNFKKIASIAASVLMAGMSMGLASAAAFPAPFVQNGSANAAIVWGTGQGVSQTDYTAASNIAASLANSVTPTGTTNISGENFYLGSGADKIWMNTSMNSAGVTLLTKSDLPNVLKDTTFNGNTDSKITSTISIGANKVTFDKQPTSDTDPQLGVAMSTSNSSYLYKESITMPAINFTSSDSKGQTIHLFGKDFVVSTETSSANGLVLYKSAQTLTLSQGSTSGSDSATVNVDGVSYTIQLLNAGTDSAIIGVNGASQSVNTGSSRKINGIDIAVTSVQSSTAGGNTATILVGAQKLTFQNGDTVLSGSNDDPIDGTKAFFTGSIDALTGLTVEVYAPDASNDSILAGQSFEDPVFGSLKVAFTGASAPLNNPDRGMLNIKGAGDKGMSLTMTDNQGNEKTFDFIYNQSGSTFLGDSNGYTIADQEGATLYQNNYTMIGNENYGHLLQLNRIYNYTGSDYSKDAVTFQDVLSGDTYQMTPTGEGTGRLTIDGRQYDVVYSGSGETGTVTLSYPTSDSSSTQKVLFPTIKTKNGALVSLYEPQTVDLTGLAGLKIPNGDGYTTISLASNGTGNWSIDSGTYGAAKNVTVGRLTYHFTAPSGASNNTVVSLVDPESNAIISTPGVLVIEGKDDNSQYNAVVAYTDTSAGTSSDPVGIGTVSSTSPTWYSKTLQSNSDITEDVDYWGTLITENSGTSSQKTVSISYPKDQLYSNLYFAESDATVSNGAGSLGNIIYKDSEVSSITADNVIIVGGSCINSAAATVLGVSAHTCGDAFTQATGVGAGQYLIEGFNNPGLGNAKYALVVAGYGPTDTMNAATYLKMKNPDLASKWVGTSATEATVVTTQ